MLSCQNPQIAVSQKEGKAPIDFVRVLPIFEYDLPIPTAVALLALLDPEGWQSGLMHRS